MAEVLLSEDPFCITFGKENWDTLKNTKPKEQPQ